MKFKLKQIRIDGYKNLIDCQMNLVDFNVLVGPNNSGKSNLLEVFHMLGGICSGNEEINKLILKGNTPPPRAGSSVCHLDAHKNKPLTIGISFELTDGNNVAWIVAYDVMVECNESEDKGKFVSEILTAKPICQPGASSKYIERQGENLKVKIHDRSKPRSHKIANTNSAMQAIWSLYPHLVGLPPEFTSFFHSLLWVGRTNIIALSPTGLRGNIDKEKPVGSFRISSFDLLQVIDKIKQGKKYYKLFIENFCDILDLETAHLWAEDAEVKDKGITKGPPKRMRAFFIKRNGSVYYPIEEYSDGTFAVAAILAILLSENTGGPVLCLEEIENCLHPEAVEKLLRFLQDHADKWPVLITTHSPYVLNGINPEEVNVAVVDKTGATHIEKVKNTSRLREYLNKGLKSFGDLLINDFEGFRDKGQD